MISVRISLPRSVRRLSVIPRLDVVVVEPAAKSGPRRCRRRRHVPQHVPHPLIDGPRSGSPGPEGCEPLRRARAGELPVKSQMRTVPRPSRSARRVHSGSAAGRAESSEHPFCVVGSCRRRRAIHSTRPTGPLGGRSDAGHHTLSRTGSATDRCAMTRGPARGRTAERWENACRDSSKAGSRS